MPPRLTSRQIFIAGAALAAIGVALALVTDGWLTVIFESAEVPNVIAGAIALIVREICMTLGLILVGASVLARHLDARGEIGANGNDPGNPAP
jgi:hypothetical protein